MSTVKANLLRAPDPGVIRFSSYIHYPGAIIQTKTKKSISRNAISMPASGFSPIKDLDLTITPKYSNSRILLTWVVNCESNYNMTFVVARNGALIADVGYEGYNSLTTSGYSGVASGQYDFNDQASTQSNLFIQYFVPAGSTSERTYSLGVRQSDGAAGTFYLNRTVSSTGADNYEQTSSISYVMEIAQ